MDHELVVVRDDDLDECRAKHPLHELQERVELGRALDGSQQGPAGFVEIRNNGDGVRNATGNDTNSNMVIENTRFEYNHNNGVLAGNGSANISIRNSVLANNNVGVTAGSSSQTQPVLIVVDTCTIAHNGEALHAEISVGSATIRVTNSTIFHNQSGMFTSGAGAAIESYGNNRVLANTNNSTFSGSVLPLQ